MTAVCTALLALIWTQTVQSTLEYHQHEARIKVDHHGMKYRTLSLLNTEESTGWKLLKDPQSSNIYAGSSHSLYMFNNMSDPKKVCVPIFKSASVDSSTFQDCSYSTHVLTEGKKGNPLFICGKLGRTKCCKVDSQHNPVDCFTMSSEVTMNESFLYIGDTLFYTISGMRTDSLGFYKLSNNTYTWPQQPHTAQKYVKIITDEHSEGLDGKLYTFYIENNTNPDPETPSWIPRVAQFCMADKGGIKNHLQQRWTSMLTARLFCGDKTKKMTFTELLDVAVLEAENWNNTRIYALFKNEYNISAVCVYRMSRIIQIFTSSKFKEIKKDDVQPQAGECVSNFAKNTPFLTFMEKRPLMEDWIEPEQLLVSRHHYTHLQVDKVNSHSVLFMSLESGKIHKVLEQDGFIIAEYQPFNRKTYIHSMLLDRDTKNLYVSSSKEVVQINLHNCSLYGEKCDSCVLARDPYCGWNNAECSVSNGDLIQDVESGNSAICEEGPKVSLARTSVRSPLPLKIRHGSKYFLQCSAGSQHASYTWSLNGKSRECTSTTDGCILLIESMNNDHEGFYECVASENGQNRTITSYRLASNAFMLRVAPVTLACLLLLIGLI